ncbi:MAG: leucine-rich repeat domain-containing protein [Oscillospiraceae bacterium]|nr:leucine-rich repeat domain-containing protein [Oscillospiraceae bacterium]
MNFKKLLLSCLMAVIVLVACITLLPTRTQAAGAKASGNCGKELSWVMDDVCVLTISGTGAMDKGDVFNGGPWHDYCDSILQVVIQEGVTSIGNCAFVDCKNITSVSIADSVTSIGTLAFSDCENLSRINIPSGITKIGGSAFSGFGKGRAVYITDLTAWMHIAFENVESNPLYPDGSNLYLNDVLLTDVTIPEGITVLNTGVLSSDALVNVVIPEGVTQIKERVFGHCKNLTSITLPNSVTSLGKSAFYGTAIEKITLPGGITNIPDYAFMNCVKLTEITIPSSVTSISKLAFFYCKELKDVYFEGTQEQWDALAKNLDDKDYLLRADLHILGSGTTPITPTTPTAPTSPTAPTIPTTEPTVPTDAQLVVYSDDADLSIEIGDTVTVWAELRTGDEKVSDTSGITFQFSDTSLVEITDSGIRNGQVYVTFKGARKGITFVTFTDSASGAVSKAPITVQENNGGTFTLTNLPELEIYDFTTNIHNFNGLYIDNYRYSVNDDKSAQVRFDVYNSNLIYGIVEVYTSEGELYHAELIKKHSKHNTSLYEVYGEGLVCLVGGDHFNYRGGFNSTLTSISITVPKNGGFKVTTDPYASDILAIVNATDFMLSTLSLTDKVNGYKFDSDDLPKELTARLLTGNLLTKLKNEGITVANELFSDIDKNLLLSSKSLSAFAGTLSHNLVELDVLSIIGDCMKNSGVSLLEGSLLDAFGVFGDGIEFIFMGGQLSNQIIQGSQLINSVDTSWLLIVNQGGGFRASQQIKLESDTDFDAETALQVYKVDINQDLLDLIKSKDKEGYQILTQSLLHTYNISLVKNGEETQHSDKVTVYIPIPYDLQALSLSGNVCVYRIEEDGSLTNMFAKVENGCMVFKTDHFSLYTLVGGDAVQNTTDPTTAPTTVPATAPTTKPTTEPTLTSTSPSDTIEQKDKSSSNGFMIVIVAVVVLAVGCVGTFIVIKKKKA